MQQCSVSKFNTEMALALYEEVSGGYRGELAITLTFLVFTVDVKRCTRGFITLKSSSGSVSAGSLHHLASLKFMLTRKAAQSSRYQVRAEWRDV